MRLSKQQRVPSLPGLNLQWVQEQESCSSFSSSFGRIKCAFEGLLVCCPSKTKMLEVHAVFYTYSTDRCISTLQVDFILIQRS